LFLVLLPHCIWFCHAFPFIVTILKG
jgi:hypothetical protein